MNNYKLLNSRFILIFVALTFGSGNLYAQHLFSISYNNLSQENTRQIKEQVASSDVSNMSLTRGIKGEYDISLSTVQNTKIIILNEETGNNVVITPTEESPAQFLLQPFFIEELKRSVLGDANRLLMVEVGTDFSVRNTASLPVQSEEVFIPRYFYGPKEDVKEALPEDRQIMHIFKEKPRLIPAFPDDPENLRDIAQLEEEMSYYVYMYQLPDGTLCIYDEHFNPSAKKNGISINANTRNTSSCCTNIWFYLCTTTLNAQQWDATAHACMLWSAQLTGIGTIPVDIQVESVNLGNTIVGYSLRQPHYWNPATQKWYSSALGNQLAGYKLSNLKDIKLEMNSNFSWYNSTTGTPNNNQFDWITVALHEITHGLGFSALIRGDGRYVYNTSAGDTTSTPYPGIFDHQLYHCVFINNVCWGANLTDPLLTPTQRANLIKSGELYAGRSGSYLLAANNGNRVKMYAPSNWTTSSVSHWDDGTDKNFFSTFMEHSIDKGFRRIVINAREVAIMQDMGWVCPQTVNLIDENITTNTTVRSCSDINVANVTVTNNAKLTLEVGAGSGVIFTGDLDLVSGELEIR